MDATRSIKISLPMYAYDGTPESHDGDYGGFPHPRDIADPIGVSNKAWIPQTISESIWKLYEFETQTMRNEFLSSPPKVFAKADIATPDQAFYNHWLG